MPHSGADVVLVTGAASGIGRACARAFAAADYAVALVDRDRSGLDAVAAELGEARCASFLADVREESEVAAAVSGCAAELGELSALVTCAGIVRFGDVHETALEDWREVIEVNLTGTFLACKHGIASMLRGGGGSIVTIGSVSALVAGNTQVGPGYKASKGGVLQLSRLIAAQYGNRGIRVNCLCPGPIATEIVAAGAGDEDHEEHFAKLAAGVPMGRAGLPEEVASAALFLASPASAYMTGSALVADGGYTAV